MQRPFTVSVIISTYNRADLLPDAIESLLNQTYVPDEIVVVDDGSTDNTSDILALYAPSVIAITQPNRGPSAGRNVGLRIATGDLIAFLDSDDTLHSNSIERRVQILNTHPAYRVVYTDVTLVDMNTSELLGTYAQTRRGFRPSGDVFFHQTCYNLAPIHAFMFYRTCLEQIGLFDEALHYHEDADFWQRMASHYDFIYLNESLASYRVHNSMTTRKQPERMHSHQLQVRERAFELSAYNQLTPQQKARLHSIQGTQYALLGKMSIARHYYYKSIRIAPRHMRGYVLGVLTLLGESGFRRVMSRRRKHILPYL